MDPRLIEHEYDISGIGLYFDRLQDRGRERIGAISARGSSAGTWEQSANRPWVI
ncbi:MAG: hypothetical protein WC000_05500 [Dokdonella sp.]